MKHTLPLSINVLFNVKCGRPKIDICIFSYIWQSSFFHWERFYNLCCRPCLRHLDAETSVYLWKHKQPPRARGEDPEHLVPTAGDGSPWQVWGNPSTGGGRFGGLQETALMFACLIHLLDGRQLQGAIPGMEGIVHTQPAARTGDRYLDVQTLCCIPASDFYSSSCRQCFAICGLNLIHS